MAVEQERACGFRTQYSLYIIGSGEWTNCDRLPFKLEACPCCGEIPHFTRSIARINPIRAFGTHNQNICKDDLLDYVCYPPNDNEVGHGIMWVGDQFYTMNSFKAEVMKIGFSKKIGFLPAWLKKDESIIYLAKQQIINEVDGFHPRRGDKKLDGVFMAITVRGIEYILPESEKQNKELLKEIESKGIIPVFVPDDDPDHKPTRKKRRLPVVVEEGEQKPKYITHSLDDYI